MKTIPTEEALTQQAAGPAKKTVQMPVGIPDYTLQEEERTIPAGEPPVWPINRDLKFVGKPVPRYDGEAKATGRARYTSDVQLPGMLYAKFVNATVPHAKVLSIDTSAAEKVPGVRGVHVIQKVLGNAELRNPALDTGKYPVVRYAGQPVAAVAATSAAARFQKPRAMSGASSTPPSYRRDVAFASMVLVASAISPLCPSRRAPGRSSRDRRPPP